MAEVMKYPLWFSTAMLRQVVCCASQERATRTDQGFLLT